MAFLSEIKARLGLDISPFERGLSNAQKSGGNFAGKFGKQIAGTEKIGGALAVALGLNIQNIAENFARLWTGVSKGAEDAFGRIEKASDAATKRIADRIQKARSGMSDEKQLGQLSREKESIARQIKSLGVQSALEAKYGNILGRVERIAKLDAKRFELGGRLEEIADEEAKIRADGIERVDKASESVYKDTIAAREESKKRAFDQLSTEEKMADVAEEINRLKAIYRDESAMTISRAEANLELEKKITEYVDLKAKKRGEEKDMAKAVDDELKDFFKFEEDHRKNTTAELKKQTEEMKNQRKQVVQTLAEYDSAQRKNVLPSSDDVRSGKRNIGSGARRQVSDLDRAKQDEQRAADRAQRAFERRNQATTGGERDAQEKERESAVRDLQSARGRRAKLEGGLEGRVSDIDTNKASLKKLEEIDKKLATLNTALASTAVQ